uniref:Orf238 n=1 Tax=Porphyra purpurea TaxID=2787 RepID=O99975_PORPU|nr:orf238 [Porphyra purpurea]AAD03102.1 orf238 [Porphyra purpurea]
MTFITNIIEHIDPETVYTAVSVGVFATSILLGNLIKTPPVPRKKKVVSSVDVKLILKELAERKKNYRLFAREWQRYNTIIHNDPAQRSSPNLIAVYFNDYIKVFHDYNDARKFYAHLFTKVRLSKIDRLLIEKTSLVNSPIASSVASSVSSGSFEGDCWPYDGPFDAFLTLLFCILFVYFCISHWNIARYVLLFFFVCYTAVYFLVWRYFFYQPELTVLVNLYNFIKSFILNSFGLGP